MTLDAINFHTHIFARYRLFYELVENRPTPPVFDVFVGADRVRISSKSQRQKIGSIWAIVWRRMHDPTRLDSL